ncbi:hypothetical protein M0R45_018192 [Rubus argutus]|uniref:Cell wall hydroxyproline-rich glycoprotein n=1 Tax=Rubus argutus TaxID=59490 RepID=A0AAW1X571_RUBAR
MKSPNLILALFIIILSIISISKSSHQVSYSPQTFPINARLQKAYEALQAWKLAITSDPNHFTANWCGPNVCNYTGVFCAQAPDYPHITTVAGVDLNHANIAGSLPEELGLLTDLALLHINSNNFCGTIPSSFRGLYLLYELDISNNQFSGPFPSSVLCLPSLKYLDIRYNNFEGRIPPALFDLKLDALFLNNNKFQCSLPQNIGNSSVSVIVLANNDLKGRIPLSLDKMKDTLNEVILMNSGLEGCLPSNIGCLDKVTVFDVSNNKLDGSLPESMGGMKSLEQLNVANNRFSGQIPASVCSLHKLESFNYSNNYFCGEPEMCVRLRETDDTKNCIPYRPFQRSTQECATLANCGALPPPP